MTAIHVVINNRDSNSLLGHFKASTNLKNSRLTLLPFEGNTTTTTTTTTTVFQLKEGFSISSQRTCIAFEDLNQRRPNLIDIFTGTKLEYPAVSSVYPLLLLVVPLCSRREPNQMESHTSFGNYCCYGWSRTGYSMP